VFGPWVSMFPFWFGLLSYLGCVSSRDDGTGRYPTPVYTHFVFRINLALSRFVVLEDIWLLGGFWEMEDLHSQSW